MSTLKIHTQRFTSDDRLACIASWNALLRNTPRPEALTMTHASFAGYLLSQHDGDARAALLGVPDDSVWFEAVRTTIEKIIAEETP